MTIFTDWHRSYSPAIQEVFNGEVNHFLCIFHLYRNLQKRFGKIIKYKLFSCLVHFYSIPGIKKYFSKAAKSQDE